MKKCFKFMSAVLLLTFLTGMLAGCGNSYKKRDTLEAPTSYLDAEYDKTASPWQQQNAGKIAEVMKKAESGQDIVIATLGGSITQGTISTGKRDKEIKTRRPYADIFFEWWEKTFPDVKVTKVNAGIGGTNSYLGVHRVEEDVLYANPDLVLIEYSVNDGNDLTHKKSYENLVRKLLYMENAPAIMLLFMAQSNGASAQGVHSDVGILYELPMVSYKNVMEALYKEGFTEADMSSDSSHPSVLGHAIVGEMLWRYLNNVYEKVDTYKEYVTPDVKPSTREMYQNAEMLDCKDITADALGGFSTGSKYVVWEDCWSSNGGEGITFTLSFKSLGFLFYRTTDKSYGTYEVIIDGKNYGKMAAFKADDWGNYGYTMEMKTYDEEGTHTVTLRPAEGEENKKFTLIRLLVGHEEEGK